MCCTNFFFFFFKGQATHEDLPFSPPRPSPDRAGQAHPPPLGRPAGQPDDQAGDREGDHAADGERHHRRIERLRSEEHTSELQSRQYLVCRLLLEKKKKDYYNCYHYSSSTPPYH